MRVNYEEICPGIRGAVRWFRSRGFNTTDSGDGSHFKEGMECAMEEPMVSIEVSPDSIIQCSHYIDSELREMGIANIKVEASYSPNEPAFILVYGSGLLRLNDVPIFHRVQ